jgi:F-type H+-transporting ATPase subunit b
MRALAVTLGAAALALGGLALAQQPGQPPPVGQVRPGPPGRPPQIIGPDGRIQGLPPGGRQPPMGRPGMPGMPMPPGGGRQGFPPGFPGHPGQPPTGRPPGFPGGRPGFPPAQHPAAAEEEHAGGEHECPGHGPEDPPPPPNLWHGNLGVDNEKSQSGRVIDQLLWRYNNPKDPCDAKNEAPPFTASLFNFAILCFILYRYARKPLADALAKRKETITAEIDVATKLEGDAAARLDEYEDRIENIEAKLDEVRAEYAAQAEVEKKHILAEAEDRRGRMRRDAQLRVEQELKAAQEELLREAVLAATAAAEALVRGQISSADHDRMAQDYLASIGPSLSVGGPS